uniref:EF-hand domain-containing protein n=1 Tax=Alexandrium monilatum TaxID=311494 RepID=A0A7S4S6F6_9DINO
MERTWSQGLEQRRARRAERQNDILPDDPQASKGSCSSPSETSLPVISPNGSSMMRQGCVSNSRSEPSLHSPKKKGRSPNRSQFLERQYKHPSIQARRDLAVLHKQLIKDAKASDDVEFLGAKGAKGFRLWLEQKFGSVVAGWRALDREKTGRISFYEFCNACRAMGYHGNLKQTWDQLDVKKTGAVSLLEIDKEVGHYVGAFKVACLRKWGDLLTAWKKGIDTSGTGRVQEPELAKALSTLGLDAPPASLNARKLLNMFRSGPKGMGMTLMDFDPDAYNRWVTGDSKALDVSTAQDQPQGEECARSEDEVSQQTLAFSLAGGGPRAFRAQLKEASRRHPSYSKEKVELKKLGMHSVEGFKAALITRCGSMLGAWRQALDLDGNGRITFCEFCQAMKRLGYQADTLGLWKKLDQRGDGKVTLKDLDPDLDAALSELQGRCEEVHGNMLLAWLKEMDKKGTGIVNEAQFTRACQKLGISGSPKQLFRLMQPDLTRKFLTLQDFDTKAFLALSRGDYRMLSEQPDEARKTALERTFMERQEAGWFFQIRKAWEMSRREEFAKACQTDKDQEVLIDTIEQFEGLCVRRFGSMLSAWRQVIDWDGNGKITFNEFCQALRRLGYAGNIKGLWTQYDKDNNGHISLKEMDPETDTMISSLHNLLTEKYGSIDAAWLLGFGKDPHDSCNYHELKEVCDSLGYTHDVEKLFKMMQLMPGRMLITIWDLDPTCNRKRQRGDVRVISSAKSPTWEGGAKRRQHSPGAVSDAGALEDGACGGSIASGPSVAATSSGNRCDPELQTLKQYLRIKHGSTVAAWRSELDPDMQGTLSFGKLMIVLEECGFQGNVKGLWEELALGRAGITLRDIDPEAVRLLDRFREQLLSKYGSLVKAWEAIDSEGAGRLDQEDFVAACTAQGINAKNPKKAFQLLRARLGQRSLVVEDFTAMLLTLPSEKRAQAWSGSGAAGSAGGCSDAEELAESDNDVASPGQTTTERPWLPKEDPSSPRSKVEQATRGHHDSCFNITTLEGFRRNLVRRNGSLFAAWRHCLDVDRNGVVTQQDFAVACRSLGVKSIPQLWAELDTNKDGQISLKEIDPETAELFGELERLLLDRHGSTKEGWRRVFLPTGSPWCEQETFVEQCKVMGFSGDADRLYHLIKPEAGRRCLTYEDLWPNLDPNLNRSESEMDWWMRAHYKDQGRAGSEATRLRSKEGPAIS